MLLEGIAGKDYCEDLVTWIGLHHSILMGLKRWLSARGLDFEQYLTNMQSDGMCDVLELWLVSVITGQALNVV